MLLFIFLNVYVCVHVVYYFIFLAEIRVKDMWNLMKPMLNELPVTDRADIIRNVFIEHTCNIDQMLLDKQCELDVLNNKDVIIID